MSEKLNYIASSKKQIWDAYKAAIDELEAKKASVIDPLSVKKEQEKVRVAKSAEETVSQDWVSPALVQKYNDLKLRIAEMESYLKDLTEFEGTYFNVVALVNSYNSTKTVLDESAKKNKDARENELKEMEANLREEILNLQKQLESTKKKVNEEEKIFKADVTTARSREAAEYTYNLNRARAIENDKWNDEKAAREAELAKKEADILDRLTVLEGKEAEVASLKAKVDEIPALVQESFAEGLAKGKADADKSNHFEKKAIEKNAECDKKTLTDKIALLESTIEQLSAKNSILEEKLDKAYTRNQEIATAVASAGVKIVTSDSDKK